MGSQELKKGVTILVCTFNGKERLKQTLECLQKLEFEKSWEVILVDNASTDNTYEVLEQYLHTGWDNFKLVRCEEHGKFFALWKGIEHSDSEYILICDDDNHLSVDYLQIGFTILESNPSIGALGGKGVLPQSTTLPDDIIPFSKAFALGPQNTQNGKLPEGNALYGAGCFFRTKALLALKASGFRTFMVSPLNVLYSNGEDTEMCLVLQYLGWELWYDENLRFFHQLDPKRLNWNSFVRLKREQAATFPILEAFRFKYSEVPTRFKRFLIELYVKQIVLVALLYLGMVKNPSNKNRVKLIENLARLKSFRRNIPQALNAFSYVSKITS